MDVLLLTNRDGGDLSVEVQHAVSIHIYQVVAPALLIVTEEVDCTNILGKNMLCIIDSTQQLNPSNTWQETQIINATITIVTNTNNHTEDVVECYSD